MAKPVPGTVALFLILVFHLSPHPATAVLKVWVYDCDNVNGNYTSTGTFKTNLDTVLTKMVTTDISYGFYNFSAGEAPDTANLISLCRGDVSVDDCHTCQTFVKSQMDSLCSNQKTAIFWSDDCMVRYSNESIFGVLEETPYWFMGRPVTIDSSDTARYDQVVGQVVESLPGQASAGDSALKFATNQSDFNSSLTIYSAAQCTPDLTQKECLQCLDRAVSELRDQSSGQRGSRFLFPSCNVRYEETKFYLSDGSSKVVSPSPAGKGGGKKTAKIIVAAIAGSICGLLFIVACIIFIRKGKLHWNLITSKLFYGDDIISIDSLQFNYNTIRTATGNFADANKLGEGGFGAVYKGTVSDNQEIAVKRLACNSSQGEDEFKTEVMLLAKLQHRNLVRLLGFSIHNKERLLIYEFVANASLDHFLFGANRRAHLNWETRYKIIKGIARGILYLHEDSRLRIIHRDLKASNVLLDEEMCPKIADFGTARLFDIDQTHSDTRRIVGTYGYMAPEYALYGNFSTKSDVYSFGVLLLEIVCGKKCSTLFSGEISESLVHLVWRKWGEGKSSEVVDSGISGGSELEILRCIHIGLLCIQDNMVERPSMSSIVLMMSSLSTVLPLPSQPAYIFTSNMQLHAEDGNKKSATDTEPITELQAR